MPERFRDFDAFWAETTREPVKFRYGGKTYELPPEIPAIVILKAVRLAEDEAADKQVSPDDVIGLATNLLGSKNMDALLASGISIDRLGDVVKWALEQYGAGPGDEGNAEAPAQS